MGVEAITFFTFYNNIDVFVTFHVSYIFNAGLLLGAYLSTLVFPLQVKHPNTLKLRKNKTIKSIEGHGGERTVNLQHTYGSLLGSHCVPLSGAPCATAAAARAAN